MNELELKKAIAEAAKTAGQSPNGRSSYAELLIETVQPNRLSRELFSRFMPVRQLQPGDATVKRLRRRRYPVQTMVPGTAHLTGQVGYSDTYTWVFDRLITGARESVWNLQNNPVLTTATLRRDLENDLIDNLFGRVFDLISQVWNGTDTPNNYLATYTL